MKKQQMIDELKELLHHGYEVYVPNRDECKWAMVTTPKGNLLYIQCARYVGYDILFKYVPSRKCGTGCSANGREDNPYNELTLETIQTAEERGLTFTHKLHATLYSSIEDALKGVWNFEDYYKLKKEGKQN